MAILTIIPICEIPQANNSIHYEVNKYSVNEMFFFSENI